jgi:hypothetical protein
MCLQFGFVIFRRKDFGAKAVIKMLVKLTPAETLNIKVFQHNYIEHEATTSLSALDVITPNVILLNVVAYQSYLN